MNCFCGNELDDGIEICDDCRNIERELAIQFAFQHGNRNSISRDDLHHASTVDDRIWSPSNIQS